MKILLRKVVAGIAAVLSTVTPAFAQTVEPDAGFTRGASPEWQQAHEESESSAPAHRQYHQDAEAMLRQWLQANPPAETLGYDRLLRDVHANRNLDHRQYHDPVWEPESIFQPMGTARAPVMPDTVRDLNQTPVIVRNPLNPTPGVDRNYSGDRPSRRSIVQAAESQFRR
ncbi:MAG TPA: hypothetical protein VI913_00905 [Candidatus Peribacteraceae bacterium]|nr:hypothetical protein [Candidatus Peribacteraceae bacterium]